MKVKGPWSVDEIQRFLDQSVIPARIAVLSSSGAPLVLSLWFLSRDGAIWCACNRRARVVELLRHNPSCGFEIASELPPYRGVRGQGTAELDAPGGAQVLSELLARYRLAAGSRLAGMLLQEAARSHEVAIRIAPRWISSWDFTARMADAFEP